VKPASAHARSRRPCCVMPMMNFSKFCFVGLGAYTKNRIFSQIDTYTSY